MFALKERRLGGFSLRAGITLVTSASGTKLDQCNEPLNLITQTVCELEGAHHPEAGLGASDGAAV